MTRPKPRCLGIALGRYRSGLGPSASPGTSGRKNDLALAGVIGTPKRGLAI